MITEKSSIGSRIFNANDAAPKNKRAFNNCYSMSGLIQRHSMPALQRIAYYQNRRDEAPNQELAQDLVAKNDWKGIREIADNLWNKNAQIQSDCLKVLYEIGFLQPELIAPYAQDFLKLLHSRNNRLVWGATIALSTVADLKADAIYPHVKEIEQVMDQGSVITRDNGVIVLALVAAQKAAYSREIFPYLLRHLETCRPKDVPQHAEKTAVAVNARNKQQFIAVLEKRLVDLSGSQATRVKKVIKEADQR
jgi:hypothetical protein